jgi:hypothetical protein
MQINYVRYRTFILLLRSFAVLLYFISVTKPTQNTAAKQRRRIRDCTHIASSNARASAALFDHPATSFRAKSSKMSAIGH